MNNWGRDREIEKPKKRMVYLVTLHDHPARVFATEQSALNFRTASLNLLREAYRATGQATGQYFNDASMKIYPFEVER